MEEILNEAVPQEDVLVVDIQFRPGQKVYYFDPAGFTLNAGDHVIIDTARGAEYGLVTGGNHEIPAKDVVPPLRQVLRIATANDEKIVAENRQKEKKACEICLQKIEELGLDMQLVSAEVAFDGSKILSFFTADERVDFRELVKILASNFHTRIELRQIGVRDKAKMVGGLGICGRPFCCASFLDDFQPVSIKMAKTQNLSLNPTKISGTCGRLMCCLKYEQEAYEDLIRRSPKEESFVDTPEGRGTVVEVKLLRQQVKVRLEDEPETAAIFPIEDIAVYRNGKAKKNDAPVPDDWAPISGSGKRVRKQEPDEPRFLDPIRFRYSEESIVEEPPAEEPAAQPEEESKAKSRRRKNKNKQPKPAEAQAEEPKKEQPKKEQPKKDNPAKEQPKQKPVKKKPEPKQETPAEPAEAGEAAEKPKNRRPHHRRHYRKPSQGKAE